MNTGIDSTLPSLADMLFALAGVALARDGDGAASSMVEAARRLRPDSPLVEAFDGWFCVRRDDLLGATRHLSSAVEILGAQAGSTRTLLAMVLCAQDDPAWLTQAQLVIDENVDANGAFLMRTLMGERDPEYPQTPSQTPSHLVRSDKVKDGASDHVESPARPGDRRTLTLRG